MKKIALIILFQVVSLNAHSALMKCQFGMAGAPLGDVKLPFDENGQPGEYADVSLFFAPVRKFPVTVVPSGTGESLRAYLAKEDPQNELLLIVKNPEGSLYKSILINASAPAGAKELQGSCTF
ncbi:hypothetical protein D3C87_1459070 [compost metagenome]